MPDSNWPAGLLASNFWQNDDPQRLAMAIANGYFEMTETAGVPPRLTVCGYVSSKSRWRLLEQRWPRVLRQEGLSAFNVRDLSRGTGEYASGWRDNQPRTERLVGTLNRLTEQHVLHAFASSMRLDEYDSVNEEYCLSETVAGPYGVCAGHLMTRVRAWMAEHRPEDLTLFVFEDGDLDHREIARILRARGIDRGEPVQVWRRQWIDEHGRRRYLRPFEACDLLFADTIGAAPAGRSRRLACDHDTMTREELRRICDALSVSRRAAGARQAVLSS
jgi:hypothetical protein